MERYQWFGLCVEAGVTYEKVTPTEGDPVFQVPFLTAQEFTSIMEDIFLYPGVEDDGVEETLGMRGGKAPTVAIGGIDRHGCYSCLFPEFLSFLEKLVKDPVTSTKDTTQRIS